MKKSTDTYITDLIMEAYGDYINSGKSVDTLKEELLEISRIAYEYFYEPKEMHYVDF